jgi:hypothetical protein
MCDLAHLLQVHETQRRTRRVPKSWPVHSDSSRTRTRLASGIYNVLYYYGLRRLTSLSHRTSSTCTFNSSRPHPSVTVYTTSMSSPGGTYDDRDNLNDLKLDPGVPARRNRSSGCKCVLITILTSIASLTVFFIGVFLVNFIHLVREPNAAMLYKTSADTPVDPAAVVRPLIDEKHTFDIVATVWLRTNNSSPESTISTLPAEKAIFTGKVFEGLTLKDKSIHTTVNYTVPTEILYVFFCILHFI